jgi:hypothetical protein
MKQAYHIQLIEYTAPTLIMKTLGIEEQFRSGTVKLFQMKQVERDLLILLHEDRYSEQQIQYAVKQISDMLTVVETMEYLCNVMEVADCNRNRVTSKRTVLKKVFARKEHKPFEFIIHKN